MLWVPWVSLCKPDFPQEKPPQGADPVSPDLRCLRPVWGARVRRLLVLRVQQAQLSQVLLVATLEGLSVNVLRRATVGRDDRLKNFPMPLSELPIAVQSRVQKEAQPHNLDIAKLAKNPK